MTLQEQFPSVPVQNDTGNENFAKVIGNKTDNHQGGGDTATISLFYHQY